MVQISIRPIETEEEIIQAVRVQKKAWSRSKYSLIPPTIFRAFIHNSGCVLGAFDEDNPEVGVVGYVLGFMAKTPSGTLYHQSQQVAVHPKYQNKGIGTRLKRAQRDFVKNQLGLKLITWTVDPLLAQNAVVNYRKLGAIGRIYWVNYYGSNRNDRLNAGLETDRIELEWWFRPYEERRIQEVKIDAPAINGVPRYITGLEEVDESIIGQSYLVTLIPPDLVALKEGSLELATRWRLFFRAEAQKLLAEGYVIVDAFVEGQGEKVAGLVWTNKLRDLASLGKQK